MKTTTTPKCETCNDTGFYKLIGLEKTQRCEWCSRGNDDLEVATVPATIQALPSTDPNVRRFCLWLSAKLTLDGWHVTTFYVPDQHATDLRVDEIDINSETGFTRSIVISVINPSMTVDVLAFGIMRRKP